MKHFLTLILLAQAIGSMALAQTQHLGTIQTAILKPFTIITLPVSPRFVTTVKFPENAPIESIIGSELTLGGQDAVGSFHLSHPEGANFFAIQALTEKATTLLHVLYKNDFYLFFVQVRDDPILSLHCRIEEAQQRAIRKVEGMAAASEKSPLLTPPEMLQLAFRATLEPLFRTDDIEREDIDSRELNVERTFDNGVRSILQQVVLYRKHDLLAFQAKLVNEQEEVVRVERNSVSIRVGPYILPPALLVGPDSLPPSTETTVYVIANMPQGSSAPLSVHNEFQLVIAEPKPPSSTLEVPTS